MTKRIEKSDNGVLETSETDVFTGRTKTGKVHYLKSSSITIKPVLGHKWPSETLVGSDYSRSSVKSVLPASTYERTVDSIGLLPSYVSAKTGVVGVNSPQECLRVFERSRFWDQTYGPEKCTLISSEDNGNIDVETLTSNAVSAAISKANSSTWDLFEELKELNETIALLASLAKAVWHPMDAFQKKKTKYYEFLYSKGISGSKGMPKRNWFRNRADFNYALGLASDAWMTYRYGIMPIMYSAKDAASVFSNLKRPMDKNRTSRATRWATHYQRDNFVAGKPAYGTSSGSYYVETVTTTSVKATVQDRLNIGLSGTERFIDETFRSIPQSMWNVVKLSWVVDWFINVEGWIASKSSKPSAVSDRLISVSVTTLSSSSGMCGSLSYSYKIRVMRYDNRPEVDHVFKTSCKLLGQPTTSRSYSRKVYQTGDVLPVKLSVDIHLTTKRFVDAIALLSRKLS